MGKNLKSVIFCAFLIQSLLITLSYSSEIVLRLYIEHTKSIELSPNEPDPIDKYTLSQYDHRRTVFAVYRDTEGNFYSSAKDVLWHSTNTQVVDLPTGPSDSINIYGRDYTYHAKITAYSPSIDTTYTTHLLCGFGASNKDYPTLDKNKISIMTNSKGCIIINPLKDKIICKIYSVNGKMLKVFPIIKNKTFVPFKHSDVYILTLENDLGIISKKMLF